VRAALLSKLRGIDVGIWGGGWEAAEGLNGFPIESWRADNITPTDAAKVYNLAKICPNVHHPQTKRGGMNTRTYEIIAAGGFELTDNVRGLEEHFEIGREILVYDSPEHFRELVDYYLSNPVERTDVIQRGRARVMRDHTYERRLQFILETIER
jgi:spore maturation protein CgeB